MLPVRMMYLHAGGLCLLMPETQGQPLLDTVDEVSEAPTGPGPGELYEAAAQVGDAGDARFTLTDGEEEPLNES